MTFEEKALAAGGHLADDVAGVLLGVPLVLDDEMSRGRFELRVGDEVLAVTLISEDTALD